MVKHYSDAKVTEVAPGVVRRVLANNDDVMVVEGIYEGDLPLHNHVHRQVTYVVYGKLEFTLGSEVLILNKGDSVIVLPDVPHGFKPLEPTMIIDFFTPARKDFL